MHYILEEPQSINHRWSCTRQHKEFPQWLHSTKQHDVCVVCLFVFFGLYLAVIIYIVTHAHSNLTHMRSWENVKVISWLWPRGNLLSGTHCRQRYINPQINTHHLVEHICERGKNIYIYIIFASVWPLLPNSLDCSRNIYGAVIRVIYPRKESLPFENGGKYKAWFALLVSISVHQNSEWKWPKHKERKLDS